MHISFTCISHAGKLPPQKMLVKVGGSLMVPIICSDLQFEGPLMNIQKQKIQWQPGIHPRNLTWNLKVMVSKWTFLFQGLIFRFHDKFRGCTSNMYGKHSMLYIEPLGRGRSVASMLKSWAFLQSSNDHCNSTTRQREWNFVPQIRRNMFQTLKSLWKERVPDAIKLFTGNCSVRKDYCTWVYIVAIPIACDRTIMMEVNIGRLKWHNLHIFPVEILIVPKIFPSSPKSQVPDLPSKEDRVAPMTTMETGTPEQTSLPNGSLHHLLEAAWAGEDQIQPKACSGGEL